MNRFRSSVAFFVIAIVLPAPSGATDHYTELRYTIHSTWVMKTPELTIRPDGTVAIAGTEIGGRRLDAATLRDLARRVAAVDWAHLKPHYEANCDDCVDADLRITVDGRPFEVTVYGAGSAGEPQELGALLRSIERVRASLGAKSPIDRHRAKAQPAGAAR